MIKLPAITGVIRRRILLNYRVAPEVIRPILPAPFRPKLVSGHAVAGICLIRLEQIRPKGLPACFSLSSENSAHRIAVEWEDGDGCLHEGVFVPRRDTDSRMNAMAGGRVFPGVHHFARFSVTDREGSVAIRVSEGHGAAPLVDLNVRESEEFPSDSIFPDLQASSRFFEAGCVGYSSRPTSCTLDGISLMTREWFVSSLEVERIQSSYFGDISIFPANSIQLDHALLMRDIPCEWHSEPEMSEQ